MIISEQKHRFRQAHTWDRWYKPVMLGITVLILALGLDLWLIVISGPWGHVWGVDYTHYLDGVRRFMATGSPYLSWEVAQPFDYEPETFLHPPVAIWLFLPFLYLPAPLWWLIPLGVTAAIIVSWRPVPWTWPIIALGIANPRFQGAGLVCGNTDLWVLAGIAAGLRFGWPALVVFAKPTLPFFLLVGIRHRSWWQGLLVVVALSLPFGGLWLDWLRVVQNSPGDLTYSLGSLPFLLVPLIAWIGRSKKPVLSST